MATRDEQQRKLELLQKLSSQRQQISNQRDELSSQVAESAQELKSKMHVPTLIKKSVSSTVSNHPTKWFLGSAIGGLVLSKVFLGKKKKHSISSSKPLLSGSTDEEKRKWFEDELERDSSFLDTYYTGERRHRSSLTGGVSKSLFTSAAMYFGKRYLKRYLMDKGKMMLIRKFLPQQQYYYEDHPEQGQYQEYDPYLEYEQFEEYDETQGHMR